MLDVHHDHLFGAHPRHQVWPGPVFPHADLQDDDLACPQRAGELCGRLCQRQAVQVEAPQGQGQEGLADGRGAGHPGGEGAEVPGRKPA